MKTSTIWRLPEVLRQTGLSRSTIYDMIGRGEFPQQVKLGRRAVGWIAEDILAWIHARVGGCQEVDPGDISRKRQMDIGSEGGTAAEHSA